MCWIASLQTSGSSRICSDAENYLYRCPQGEFRPSSSFWIAIKLYITTFFFFVLIFSTCFTAHWTEQKNLRYFHSASANTSIDLGSLITYGLYRLVLIQHSFTKPPHENGSGSGPTSLPRLFPVNAVLNALSLWHHLPLSCCNTTLWILLLSCNQVVFISACLKETNYFSIKLDFDARRGCMQTNGWLMCVGFRSSGNSMYSAFAL